MMSIMWPDDDPIVWLMHLPYICIKTLASWYLMTFGWRCTPWKMNMEPTNHPFRKENDLNHTSMIMFHVNLQGCLVWSCFTIFSQRMQGSWIKLPGLGRMKGWVGIIFITPRKLISPNNWWFVQMIHVLLKRLKRIFRGKKSWPF